MRVPRRGCDGEMRRRRKNSAVREQEESGGEGGRRGLVVVAGGSKGQRAPTMAKGCSLYLPFFPSPFYISLSVFLSPLRPCSFFLFPFPFCFTSLTWFVLHATFRGTPEVLCSCVSKYPFEGVVSSYRRAADLIFFFFFVCSLSLSLSLSLCFFPRRFYSHSVVLYMSASFGFIIPGTFVIFICLVEI